MPHIIVKMFPGRTNEQKQELADEITRAITSTINSSEKAISVVIEEVKPENWDRTVYKTDILENKDKLYKKPGYNDFE